MFLTLFVIETTVEQVKSQILAKTNILRARQHLQFGDVVLERARSMLEQYNVGNNSTLTLKIHSFETTMQIFVKTLTGKNYSLEVKPGINLFHY